jgi:hypothetical protein
MQAHRESTPEIPAMKLVLPLALAATALLAACGTTYGYRDGANPRPYYRPQGARTQVLPVGDHELVCHKGKKTLDLPPSAVQAHLGHGDHRGSC